jgi:hypothetical protein
MVSSAAHTYGRALASAEAFTSNRHWLDSPVSLKPAVDRAFCEGINRLVIHESTASRAREGKPGYEYYAGTHFNPNQTWWPLVGPFLDYIARCQFLLRQGHFVADVLHYVGDGAPNVAVPKHVLPTLGAGFDYDDCNAEVLLTRTAVKDGRIVLPDGMSYRVLALPDTPRMPIEVARKIRELVRAGATVVGPRPQQAPGLRDFPRCDDEVRAIAAEVWGDTDGKAKTENVFGRGRVYWGRPLREVLAAARVGPDFQHDEKAGSLDFVHRTTDDAEVYFVANREARAVRVPCAFRVSGRAPELWDPVSGTARAAAAFSAGENGTTALTLELAAHQSCFVVFPKGAPAASRPSSVLPVESRHLIDLPGPWSVRFDPQWGGPEQIEFAQLTDWSKHADERVRFYSGLATYRTRFTLERDALADGHGLMLELGVVKNIARVRLNGTKLGTVWTAPWQVALTRAAKPGENVLEIEVANLWPNRLIGDKDQPPEKRFTRTNIPLPADAKLLPSGLLGPLAIHRFKS